MIFSPVSGQCGPGADYHESQGFGGNAAHYAKYGLSGHNGVDLATPVGTPLYAPCEGYVHYGDEGSVGYGKYATITSLPYVQDGTRRQVTLGHLSRFIAGMEGQFVHAGDLVGISGSTGDSTGPHVHITYKKLDAAGSVMDQGNGFHGAIDVAKYVEQWKVGNVIK